MMRVCHLGTCPFGIATQNPELRKRFIGKPEYVERFMLFIAEQLRGIMAKLGARTVRELVGRADLLKAKETSPIDLSDITGFSRNTCFRPEAAHDFHMDERADVRMTGDELTVMTTDRSFGVMLKGERRIAVHGCGGQSFGAFLKRGQEITLHGESNDYLGKGLSGGTIAVCPPEGAKWHADDALIGNVALYGATSGYVFIAGMAGERFCVRNSGATAVVEGVGDHGCEYMTGGRAVILGPVGNNFAAGMSGGIAYVLDESDALMRHINPGLVEIDTVIGEYAAELKDILEKHLAATGSEIAADILDDFEKSVKSFKMVIPTEYKRVLEGR